MKRNRRAAAAYGALAKCVAMLQEAREEKHDGLARGAALCLWECAKSEANKERLQNSGIVPLLQYFLQTAESAAVLVPIVGIVEELGTVDAYRAAFREAGMLPKLVEHLAHEDNALKGHAATAIFHCADDAETRTVVREQGGLPPLVSMLSNTDNTMLLAGATGAIWKCALDELSNKMLREAKAIESMCGLLSGQSEAVVINVAGAISSLATTPEAVKAVRSSGGLTFLVDLLSGTNDALLINVCKALKMCANDKDSMAILDKDGVRLLWSLLRSPNVDVVAAAGWAICPCIKNASDAGNLVRSFVGGLELVVGLLRHENIEVISSVCAAIAEIARDQENLAIITDHGVVRSLARLVNAEEKEVRENLASLTVAEIDYLQENLAEAIANCCAWRDNCVVFGDSNSVAPLYGFLQSSDPKVHRATARALHALSKDVENCITMHRAGVVRPLIEMVGSKDVKLQEAAAYCLRNVRSLALANEMAMYG